MPRGSVVLISILAIFIGVDAGKNDTLEMELESNITVVKLEHGLKFQAHSEFGLPDNMTDLFNSTADDSEGSNNSSLPVALEAAHSRSRRSNKDGETAEVAKKGLMATLKVTSTTKKAVKKTTPKNKKKTTPRKTTPKNKKKTTPKRKVTTKKPKVTTKKVKKVTTKKKQTTKKRTTKKLTTVKPTTTTQIPHRPATQHWIPNTGVARFFSKLLTASTQYETVLATISKIPENLNIRGPFPSEETRHVQRPQEPTTTTRRVFVMYEDDELIKKNQGKNNHNDNKKDHDFDWRD